MYKFFGKFLPDGSWIINTTGEELSDNSDENIDKTSEKSVNYYEDTKESASIEESETYWPIEKPLLSKNSRQILFYQDWSSLSSSILKTIFQFLGVEDLTNVACVCFKWEKEAKFVINRRISSSLSFQGSPNINLSFICRELRKNGSQLTHLSLSRIPDSLVILRQICRSNPELKEFVLRYSTGPFLSVIKDFENVFSMKNIPVKNILNILTFCKKLERFDTKGTQFPVYKVVRELGHLPHLRALNLSRNRFLAGNDILKIASQCPNLVELKASNLDMRKHLIDEEACLLLQILRPRIVTLRIDCIGFGRNAFEMITCCKLLEDLGLYNAMNLLSDVFLLIGRNLTSLKSFKVDRANALKDKDFENFFATRLNNPFNRLSFPSCHGVGDNAVLAIANLCGANLTHLNIRDCQKVSEKALVRTLELCPELYKLNVAFLNISLRDILLKGNPIQLKTLVVSDRKFISPIPNLTIQVAAWPFTSLKIQTNEQPFQFFPCRTIQ